MSTAITTTEPGAGYGAEFTWGVTLSPGRSDTHWRMLAVSGRQAVNLLASLTVALAALLGTAGIGLSATSPARADIFGISDAVQDWLCGVVAPDEPWEAVGNGPEGWLPNHNLAQVSEAPVAKVTGKAAVVTTTPGRPGVPDTVDELQALPKGQYTLYEVAGLRGLSWWTIPQNVDKSRHCSLWNYIWTQGANLLFTVDKNLLQVVITLKEEAAKPQPLKFLYDASGGVMSNIFVFCFIPVAMLSLLASAIWLGLKSARGKANVRGTFSIMATGFAIVTLMAFFYTLGSGGKAGFRQAAGTVDSTISFLNATGTSAIFDGLTGNQGTCVLDKNSDPVQRGQRLTSCVLADSLAYRPWAVGQFGSAGANPIPIPSGWSAAMPAGDGKIDVKAVIAGHKFPCWVNYNSCSDLRTYLIAQHGGVQLNGAPSGEQGDLICTVDGIRVGIATASSPDDLKNALSATANCSPMYDVFNALADSDPTTAAIYAGQGSVSRVSQAFTALLAVILVCIAVLVTSVISMGWEAMTFAYFLIGPVKNGFALYAGKMKMTKDWLEDLGYSYVLRLAYGFVLAIMIVLIVWMMNSTQNFGMRLFWLAIILMGFWKIIQKVQSKLRPGVSSMAPDIAQKVTDQAEKVGRFSSRHAVHAVPGGVGSIKATRERRRSLAADPTRGSARRKISTLTAPLSYAGSGLRGAVTGSSSAAEARTANVLRRGPGSGGPPGKPPGTNNTSRTRKAGSASPVVVVKAKDAPSSTRVAPPRPPIPSPDPAGAPAGHGGAVPRADGVTPTGAPSAEPASVGASTPPIENTANSQNPSTDTASADAPNDAADGPRARVIRPVVTSRAGRPRLPAGGPGLQRPRMRTGGSPLGLATPAHKPPALSSPGVGPTDAPPITKGPNRPPQTKDPRPTNRPATPTTDPPTRRRPAAPDTPALPVRVDAVSEPQSSPPATEPPSAAPVPDRPPTSKSRASKGNSDTGALSRRVKAQPGKGDATPRPTTISRSSPQ